MKLAIISTYPPRKCGIGIYAKRLADSIKGDVRIISMKEHKYADKKAFGMIDSSLDSFLNAANYIRNNSFKSVLIEHEYAFYNKIYFLLLLLALKLRGVKINLEVHTIVDYSSFIKKSIFRIYNFAMFLLCDRIIVHTKYAGKNLPGAWIFRNKIRIMPLSVPEVKKLKGRKAGKIKLLCFGFIWHDKGTDIAVRAFGDVENVKLKIVGSINPSANIKQRMFFEKMKNMAKAYNNIEVIDRFVSEEEKEKLYEEADFIVLPYRSISQSAVLTEIWGYGRIPVCSDLAPLREEIGNNEHGILFRREDAQDLKNKVLSAAKSRKMQEKIMGNIKRMAERRSFKETANKLSEVLA